MELVALGQSQPEGPVLSHPILSRLVLSHGHEAAGAGAVLLWHVSCQPAVPPALGQCPGVPGGASEGIPGRVGRGSPARSLAPASTQVLISTTQEKPACAQNYVRREPEGNRAPGWAALTLPTPGVLYNWEIIGCLHHKARDSSVRHQPRGRRPPAPSASPTGPKFSRCHPKAEPGCAGGDRHPAPCRAGQAELPALRRFRQLLLLQHFLWVYKSVRGQTVK